MTEPHSQATRGAPGSGCQLDGRSALVTGAGREIGRGIAVALAETGADVAVSARTAADLQETAEMIEAAGRRAAPIPANVSDPDAVHRLVAEVRAQIGPPDIVVNCAGNLLVQPLVPLPGYRPEGYPQFERCMTDGEWFETLNTHLSGAMYILRELGPDLLARRFGRVINIGSVSPLRVARFNLAYDVAKGGSWP